MLLSNTDNVLWMDIWFAEFSGYCVSNVNPYLTHTHKRGNI